MHLAPIEERLRINALIGNAAFSLIALVGFSDWKKLPFPKSSANTG
jgi:hypothetical protein